MHIRIIPLPDEALADTFVRGHASGSLWQSPAWARFQRTLGREALFMVGEENNVIVASALMIRTKSAYGLCDYQVPRGPLFCAALTLQDRRCFIEAIEAHARALGALALYLSPGDHLDPTLIPRFRQSRRHEQPEATVLLDLSLSEEALLHQMKPKGRYNIGLAQKKGVIVEQSHDIGAYAAMSAETSKRDGFTAPSARQCELFLTQLSETFLLLAYPPQDLGKMPIAGLLGTVWGETGIYYYGASENAHRALMAPYLLQWEAIRLCKRLGAKQYDLLGIAPPGSPPDHQWAGITDFKMKFGGTVITYPPETCRVLQPFLHTALRLKRYILG